jgi:hypothetical protein
LNIEPFRRIDQRGRHHKENQKKENNVDQRSETYADFLIRLF